jgi:hypothetical protein
MDRQRHGGKDFRPAQSDFLAHEAALASRQDFDRVMGKVPDAPPDQGDGLPGSDLPVKG